MDLKLLQALGTALFIGALIGTERTQHRRSEALGFAGLRTFILFAELGAVLAWIAKIAASMGVFLAGLGCVTVFISVAYLVERRAKEISMGMTTEVSAIVVYVLGGTAVLGDPVVAVALSIVTAGLLATKKVLHEAVRRISEVELLATLRLLFASFIVLPILPRQPIDPWQALSPYKLWWLVILISALSMVGYVAVRIWGAARGTLVTGFFGGVVSSTAVTLTFARQSRTEPRSDKALGAATLLAWTVMYLRVAVLLGLLRWDLLPHLALPLLALCATNGILVLLVLRQRTKEAPEPSGGGDMTLKNPFRLISAMKFAVVFAAVLLATRLAEKYAPGQGLYWVSALGGSTDVDAIVLSLVELSHRGAPSAPILARAVLLAILANTLVKFGLVVGLGNRTLARTLLPATAFLVLVGGAAIAFLP